MLSWYSVERGWTPIGVIGGQGLIGRVFILGVGSNWTPIGVIGGQGLIGRVFILGVGLTLVLLFRRLKTRF